MLLGGNQFDVVLFDRLEQVCLETRISSADTKRNQFQQRIHSGLNCGSLKHIINSSGKSVISFLNPCTKRAACCCYQHGSVASCVRPVFLQRRFGCKQQHQQRETKSWSRDWSRHRTSFAHRSSRFHPPANVGEEGQSQVERRNARPRFWCLWGGTKPPIGEAA